MKPQPPIFNSTPNFICNELWMSHDRRGTGTQHHCPYGQVGDRLGVKETHYRFGQWNKNGFTKSGKQAWKFKEDTDEVLYFDNPPKFIRPNSFRDLGWYKRPSGL